jgi:hypothetical protein
MAIDKDFVVKNGLQVNENLIFADSDSDKVGLGTTTPNRKLVVIGNAEISSDLAVGTTITAQRGAFTGIITANDGLDIGVGGTFVTVNKLDAKIGIGSTTPVYTLDLYGPVSTGTTAAYIYGDLEVTGNIKGTALSGQISAGGTVGFTNVTVDNKLIANQAEVYTKFNIEEVGSDTFRFLVAGDPPGIGFTQNTDNPEIYLQRGQNYRFDVNSGGFPFYIKSQPTADLNNLYQDGVDGNGSQVGIVTFKVPFNSPNILYYQASNVSGMGGTIYINNDGKSLNTGVLTVTQLLDSDTQADFEQIYVSGIGTINNLKGPDFSVSSGILTVRQDQTALIGVSTGTDRINVDSKNDNVTYQVLFSDTSGTTYQRPYIDTNSSGLTYNPSTGKLITTRFEGNLSGIATGADNINVDQKNDNTNYQLIFSDTDGSAYQRMYIDQDNAKLIYNPSTNTLSSTNIIATTVTAGLAGTATNANYINVDKKSDDVDYQVLFSANKGSGYQRPYIDSESGQFKYNPSTNTLTAANIAGKGVNITNLDGSNISKGTINADRIPDASTTAQGVVQLYDTFPPKSTSTTTAATANLVTDVYSEVTTKVIPAGTTMLFYQSAAPTGWTKLTTQNNKALRVVSDTGGGTGGGKSATFTSVFSKRTVPLPRHNHKAKSDIQSAGHTHEVTILENGNHSHEIDDPGHAHKYQFRNESVEYGNRGSNAASESNKDKETSNQKTGIEKTKVNGSHSHGTEVGGISGNHNHPITVEEEGTTGASMEFSVQYIDVILASKDAYS